MQGNQSPKAGTSRKAHQDPKAGTPRSVYKDPFGGNPMQGNQSPKAGTPRKAHQDPKAGTPHNVYKDTSGGNPTQVQEDLKAVTSRSKDDAPTTPGQEDEQDYEAQTTEEFRSTRSSSWGPLEDGEPSQCPYPIGETTTEVCAIAIPPEPDPHVNEAEDDDTDPSETNHSQEEEPELEPWVRDFLEQELAQFETLTGVTQIAEHVINMKDDRPIKQRYYPKNPAMQRIIDQQVDELLKNNCIEPSKSPHSAPIVLVGKKTGNVRMCIDYRQLNANSIPDAYPLPRIHHILERLRNAKYISTMDPKRGYWQFPMPCAQTLPGDSVLVATFRPELRGHRPAHAALSQKEPEVGLETGTAGCIRGACLDFSEKFVLQTDASDCGLGAVLTQQHQGAERVIAYVSRRLVKAEENYSATEKECLAIVWAIRKLRCYLEGYRFDVVTDHHDNPTGQIARWALELQQYQFDIHYRRGKQNVVADALTRQPLEVILQMAQEEGPNCKWITRLTKRILEAPDRFPDFTIEGSQVYRHLGHRPEEEDYVPWKQCVAFDHPPRVLAECRKAIARISQRGLLRLSLGSAYGAVTILFLLCGHM
ncbi:hypothetical protein ACLKA6_002607 [Drosophila palustris]